jgi:putative tryptophan/tyrosine transport system substrate-binding protein
MHTLGITLLVGAMALGSPGPTVAQSAAPLPKIGLLAWNSCESPALIAGLKELGRIPGENILIECRSAGGRYDGFAKAAAELVRLPIDVIVCTSQPAGRAAREATATIPVVIIASGDPVRSGLAQSLSAPGGNVTGVTYYATELTAKRLALLREMVPTASSIGVLANPATADLPFEEETRQAAKALGVALLIRYVGDGGNLDEAFRQMKEQGAQAVFVLPSMTYSARSKHIADLALAEGLPLMAAGTWFTEAGGLMSYAVDYAGLERRLAVYADKILKGAQPGTLPIEQPARFELSINARTARALGLEIPLSLVVQADHMIESEP